ncbi:MAG: hypothetical protein ACRC9V_01260 [Aeromonas sp.]
MFDSPSQGDRPPRHAQAYLTADERDRAMAAYRRRGAIVKPDGQRGLVVIATRWEENPYYRPT